ncbi:two-component system, response regulator RegA [Roseovarius litoreus]|jgi:two-component system response regulator RegA|uniref:Two-component system, response regulator RegA n=1 Tax=Roseovarius litoreus TaxID=1155722 RepID=A0A1M7FR27_9RHOB|nr:response regulator [Roseovarius litoreus]SHM06139.1 two-component system, response regulator RegA [Roseovarius litoreus]
MTDIADLQDRTLMIVEDDDALRTQLAKALGKRGFSVTTSASVTGAIGLLEPSPPAFAVVDLRLDDGSGLSYIEALSTRRPDARPIVLTGYGNTPTAVAAVKHGAIDYLAKPTTADEIVAALLAPREGRAAPPDNPIDPDAARLEHMQRIYRESGDNTTEAARRLNMHRRTFQRRMKKLRETMQRASPV